jgi:hypothetical protein
MTNYPVPSPLEFLTSLMGAGVSTMAVDETTGCRVVLKNIFLNYLSVLLLAHFFFSIGIHRGFHIIRSYFFCLCMTNIQTTE